MEKAKKADAKKAEANAAAVARGEAPSKSEDVRGGMRQQERPGRGGGRGEGGWGGRGGGRGDGGRGEGGRGEDSRPPRREEREETGRTWARGEALVPEKRPPRTFDNEGGAAAGVKLHYGSARLSGCRVYRNRAPVGAGAFAMTGYFEITNSHFYDNHIVDNNPPRGLPCAHTSKKHSATLQITCRTLARGGG